jgi:molybdenum cofactor cytidylyltransferase
MGRPKALLPLRGRTFLENILDAIAHSNIAHTVVVSGHYRDEVERIVTAPATTVFNANYEQGMVTSFQAGIRALPGISSGALLFLVDHPLVDAEVVNALIANLAPGRIVIPVFEGRRGHPVLFAAGVLEEILALTAFEGANIVVRKDPDRVVHVSVRSAGILVDVDTPEDYLRLQNEHEPR